MALKFVANDAWRQCARFDVTDASDVTTGESKILNVVGGGRHLSYSQTGTAQRRFVYINKTNNFSADTVIITRADRHVGRDIQIGYWTTYATTWSAQITSVSWAPTLVGYNSQDFVSSITLSSAKALGVWLASTYAKTVNQIYWGSALSVNYITGAQLRPFWRSVSMSRKAWNCSELITFRAERLTRSEVNSLENLYNLRAEPLFLWDSDGKVLFDNLWHGLIVGLQVQPNFDDTHSADISFARLRGYA